MAPLPFWLAAQSGVAPRSFAASTAAPASRSRRAVSRSSRWLAQRSAVDPSPAVMPTSAPASSNSSTATASPRRAASSRSRPFALAAAVGAGVAAGSAGQPATAATSNAATRRGAVRILINLLRLPGSTGPTGPTGPTGDDVVGDPRAAPVRAPYRSASVSSGSGPVLPPTRSTGTSSLSMSVTSRFACDGSFP